MKEGLYFSYDLDELRKSSKEPIYSFLGCFDKALYFLVRRSVEKTVDFFMYSLYPIFCKNHMTDTWSCFFSDRNCLENHASCFHVTYITISSLEDFQKLEGELRKGHYIVITGDFRKIPYFLNNEDGLWGTQHTVLLVGYDNENLYFHDNLTIVIREAKQNKLSKVSKEDLLRVFHDDYKIMDIRFEEAALPKTEDIIKKFITDMAGISRREDSIEKDGEFYMTGLGAFKNILQELNTYEEAIRNRFFTDYHLVHEINISRNLFRISLEGCSNFKCKEELCQAITECITKWEYMKMQIMRNSMKTSDDFRNIMINCMEQIIKLETSLADIMLGIQEEVIW